MMRTAPSAVVPARCNRPSTSSSLPSEQRHRPAVLGTVRLCGGRRYDTGDEGDGRQAVSRMVPPSAKRTAPVATTRMNGSGESGHRAGCHADRTRDGDGLPPVPRWRGYCIRRAARCRTACRSTWRVHPTPDCNDSVREWQPRPSGAPVTSCRFPRRPGIRHGRVPFSPTLSATWCTIACMSDLSGWVTPALVCALFLYLVRRLDTLAQGMGELRERMAKLEGALEGFMAGPPRSQVGRPARDCGSRARRSLHPEAGGSPPPANTPHGDEPARFDHVTTGRAALCTASGTAAACPSSGNVKTHRPPHARP